MVDFSDYVLGDQAREIAETQGFSIREAKVGLETDVFDICVTEEFAKFGRNISGVTTRPFPLVLAEIGRLNPLRIIGRKDNGFFYYAGSRKDSNNPIDEVAGIYLEDGKSILEVSYGYPVIERGIFQHIDYERCVVVSKLTDFSHRSIERSIAEMFGGKDAYSDRMGTWTTFGPSAIEKIPEVAKLVLE